MTDKKISQLTGATTPLAGTEVLPIVQGGSTVKVSAANLTAGRAVDTGNLKVTGNMAVNATPATYYGINLGNSATITGDANPRGITSSAVYGTDATGLVAALFGQVRSTAASYTMSDAIGVRLGDASKGAGSTITNLHGVYVQDLTSGDNNYGITSLVSSGANKWNLYASGTANNYMAGNLNFAAGKGIDFSANSHAAGMTSELLDDYEEGTFTPVLNSVSYTGTASGNYVKIGQVVHVFGVIVTTVFDNTDTSAFAIGDLPFASDAYGRCTGTVNIYPGDSSLFTSTIESAAGFSIDNSTNLYLNNGVSAITYNNVCNASGRFYFAATYCTAT